MLNVAQIVDATEAEGPGTRFAVWLQGCPMRCPSCCNPEMLEFGGGQRIAVDALAARIDASDCEGVTLLGGEPFAQAEAASRLAALVQATGRSVMVFTGFTLDELRAEADVAAMQLLACCDLLVDGRYERDLPDAKRRWIGSENQRMHFLSDRYRADDPQFTAPDTVELRLCGGALTVNGWPGLAKLVTRKRSRE